MARRTKSIARKARLESTGKMESIRAMGSTKMGRSMAIKTNMKMATSRRRTNR
jgi:hypothetical protein